MLRAFFPGLRGGLWNQSRRNESYVRNVLPGEIGSAWRGIAASSPMRVKKMPDRPPPVPEEDFTEKFLCGTGPGGQKINKTSSAVQLKHIPSGLVLKVQATRSRSQNRKIAREMLALKLEEKEKGKESRVAVVAETKRKRKSSAVKKSRRKYKALEEGGKLLDKVEGDAAERTEP